MSDLQELIITTMLYVDEWGLAPLSYALLIVSFSKFILILVNWL